MTEHSQYDTVVNFPKGKERIDFDRWRMKMKQRAHRRLKAMYPDDYDRLLLEEQLADWENRPKTIKPEVVSREKL